MLGVHPGLLHAQSESISHSCFSSCFLSLHSCLFPKQLIDSCPGAFLLLPLLCLYPRQSSWTGSCSLPGHPPVLLPPHPQCLSNSHTFDPAFRFSERPPAASLHVEIKLPSMGLGSDTHLTKLLPLASSAGLCLSLLLQLLEHRVLPYARKTSVNDSE